MAAVRFALSLALLLAGSGLLLATAAPAGASSSRPPVTAAGWAAAGTGGPVEVAALVERPNGGLAVRRTRVASAAEGRRVASRLRGQPGIVAADVAVPVQSLAVPSPDPLQGDQWGLAAVRAQDAWLHGDAADQVIAVVDSGVDLGHPDLVGALVPGRDFVDGDAVPQDGNGHGTHVAGVAAGIAGNGIGGAGAALRVKVMPVRVLDDKGIGTSARVAEGVLWAVDAGADVVNLSLGGPRRDSVLEEAVGYALARGVPVVAAAGNHALDGDPVIYPAALPGVLAVGAVDQKLVRAPFSSTGSHLSLVAPGVSVLSTVRDGRYGSMSGTSMAAPFVAATAALLRSLDPAAPPSVVGDRLTRAGVDLGAPGFDPEHGHGLLDAASAQAAAVLELSPIARKHVELGGDTGLLGLATGPESELAAGRTRPFQHGAIWWSSATGAREVHGAILTTYRALGAQDGALGYPVTDELPAPDGRGRYNHFERGSVYWTSATGAREVRGAIRQTWAGLGWERSALGYPVTDELPAPDGRGRYNHFERGSVYWTPTTGAREVRGAIRQTWAGLGWERSALGYPVTDEYDVPGGRASDFERGSIRWDAATGATAVVLR